MPEELDVYELKQLGRAGAIGRLMDGPRHQVVALHKRLGLKACRCKQQADFVLQIAALLYPAAAVATVEPTALVQEKLF
jgi:hypothetical protein